MTLKPVLDSFSLQTKFCFKPIQDHLNAIPNKICFKGNYTLNLYQMNYLYKEMKYVYKANDSLKVHFMKY